MKYFKCDEYNDCRSNCKVEVSDKDHLETCRNEYFDNIAKWKEITKEEFLREIE